MTIWLKEKLEMKQKTFLAEFACTGSTYERICFINEDASIAEGIL